MCNFIDTFLFFAEKMEDSTSEADGAPSVPPAQVSPVPSENTLPASSPLEFKLPLLPPGPSKTRKAEHSEVNDETMAAVEPVSEDQDAPEKLVPEENKKGPHTADEEKQPSGNKRTQKSPAELAKANSIPLPYQEPSWGGVPQQEYCLQVLKSGVIVETLALKQKSFFTVGRLISCDIVLEHPSLSR